MDIPNQYRWYRIVEKSANMLVEIIEKKKGKENER